MRLINADETLKALEAFGDVKRENKHFLLGIKSAMEIVEGTPTFYPVRNGRWVSYINFDGEISYRCSACDKDFYLILGNPKENGFKYCPNCGAEMHGGAE